MKTNFLFVLFLTLVQISYGQLILADSTYIYDKNGVKQWYYIQKDVFCFKLTSDLQYSGDLNPCVANLSYWENAPSKFNELNFNEISTPNQRYEQVMDIQNLTNFEGYSIAISRSSSENFSAQQFYRTDDMILITFNDPQLDNNTIHEFASNYNIELVHTPSETLPSIVSWTYIFKIIPDKRKTLTTIELAQILNENEPQLIKLAEPNMYSVHPLSCSPTSEVGLNLGGNNGTWHIRNTGGIIWNGLSGLNDADADICECWGEGYTGNGIKVGIIDFGGIEFTHPDFEGTNIPKAYNAASANYHTTNFAIDPNDSHGMNVTGVVGATPNNNSLGQRWAVGAAYNATVIPYITQLTGALTTNGQIATSIQRAIEDSVDVINMSFRTDPAVGTIDIQLNNATTVGRPDPNNPGSYRGIVCVAGVGNDNIDASNFPANLPNVIGVGWTNPEDYRSAYNSPAPNGGGWLTSPGGGSTYGPPSYNYDVVAPGENIMTTNFSSSGAPYILPIGSSFSSPIVASIAAMILEKNNSLNWYEVRDLIRNGAQKVHPSTYNYNMYSGYPGYNNEMFYGRVSCINSINQTTLGTSVSEKAVQLAVINLGDFQYVIITPVSGEVQNYELYDMSGRLLINGYINPGATELPVDLLKYTSGIYLLKIYNSQKSILSTKLVK